MTHDTTYQTKQQHCQQVHNRFKFLLRRKKHNIILKRIECQPELRDISSNCDYLDTYSSSYTACVKV